jgi:PAS domain S-box-containing protein
MLTLMDENGEKQQRDAILDALNEGVFTVGLDWRISVFNRAAERITGISRAEAVGKPCWDVFHANICEDACALRRTFETGQPVVNATAHIVNNEGHRVPIRISTAILKDSTGHMIGGVESFQDLSQVEQLQKALEERYTFEDIVGRGSAMMQLYKVVPRIAESGSTVLIEGASGTGKELFARAIHNLSPRRKKPFVAVNCAALPDTLLESELFGHKAGAFTDARRDRIGRFELADGGTILLDEIGDVSPAMQMRLLRVLQDRRVEPLGAVQAKPVDIRVLAATNKDLAKLVREGAFREDLYYRIRVVHIVLPRLKERREDIPLLIEHFIRKFNRLQAKDIAGVSVEVAACLLRHEFPGNVRELENIIEQAFVLRRCGLIELEHLPPEFRTKPTSGSEGLQSRNLRILEKQLIADTLRLCVGNRKKAAAELGIDPATLYRKIRTHGIDGLDRDGRGKRR